MGLFEKKYCIDCGKAAGISAFDLLDGTKVCYNCFFDNVSVSVYDAVEYSQDVTYSVQMSSATYKKYRSYREDMKKLWERLWAEDVNMKEKLIKVLDGIYICEEYKLLVIERALPDASFTRQTEVYSIDDIQDCTFSFLPDKKDRNSTIGNLAMMIKTTRTNYMVHMVDKLYIGEVGEYDPVICNNYGMDAKWMDNTEILRARIGRIKMMSKMKRAAEPREPFDHALERALGLFLLEDDQSYDAGYLDGVRSSLVEMYGQNPEIDQAYDLLYKRITDGQ